MIRTTPLILATFVATSFTMALPAAAQDAELGAENYRQADANGDGVLVYAEFAAFIDLNAADGLGNAARVSSRGMHARAFAHDEPITVLVEGSRGLLRFVVALRQRAHVGESGEAHLEQRCLGAAGDDDVDLSPLDHAQCVEEGDDAAGAGGDRTKVGLRPSSVRSRVEDLAWTILAARAVLVSAGRWPFSSPARPGVCRVSRAATRGPGASNRR